MSRASLAADELLRRVKETEAEQSAAAAALGRSLARLLDQGSPVAEGGGVDRLTGDLSRRRFLRVGGLSVLAASVVAACSTSANGAGHGSGRPEGGTTTTDLAGVASDIAVLRTASSLEHYVVGVYLTAAGAGLLKTPAVADTAKFFADQHSQHAGVLEEATRKAGGTPFTQANPVLTSMLAPRIRALKTEQDVVRLAYEVETMATATYEASAGTFADPTLNAVTLSVGGVEARHVAVLGMILSGLVPTGASITVESDAPPYPASGFQASEGAIPPGTGV